MHRPTRHLFSSGRQLPPRPLCGSQIRQKRLRPLHRPLFRCVHPTEILKAARPGGRQHQGRLGQIQSPHLRQFHLLPLRPVGLSLETHTHSGSRPPGPPRPLGRRRMADSLHMQGFQPSSGVVFGDPGQSAIHHRLHPIQGQGRFCHVGRHHHFGPVVLFQGRILLGWRHLPVQSQHHRVLLAQPRLQIPSATVDFISTRQKHQHVAFSIPHQPLRLPCRQLRHPRTAQILPFGQIPDLHRIHPSF